ncbi:UBX domain-containing protein 1 [Penicillium frequentans]|uniref:UBX domain-containing protein 1 n=1 Tax=Penicillium frequentans TaxID=3151616 RepID=A0AAD6CK40_9EURO|nr:UBX domain-containing protein 1 [Penicillium glabrum]
MDRYPAEQDELVAQFCAMTGVQASDAVEYLGNNNGDIEAAVADFFAEQDEALQGMNPAEESTGTATGGRSLGGAAAPSSSAVSEPATKRAAPKKKFATLGDFASGSGGDSSEDDGSEDHDFFAGGEKSGLAVQNPDDLKKKILEKARRAAPQQHSDEPESRPSHFTGTARTLGGDEAPSRVIEDPTAPAPQRAQRVQRTLHFWADGFSVDDGELYRSDDPRNAEILDGIRQGRAPLGIMNVQAGQEVDVELKQHEEKYVKPKPKYKPFSGSGQRLGSPTPGIASQSSTPPPAEPQAPTSGGYPPSMMWTSRNQSATIGDVYAFVAAATPNGRDRAWVLMTTFPNNELNDWEVTLADLPDLKRGGVVVQKWK